MFKSNLRHALKLFFRQLVYDRNVELEAWEEENMNFVTALEGLFSVCETEILINMETWHA